MKKKIYKLNDNKFYSKIRKIIIKSYFENNIKTFNKMLTNKFKNNELMYVNFIVSLKNVCYSRYLYKQTQYNKDINVSINNYDVRKMLYYEKQKIQKNSSCVNIPHSEIKTHILDQQIFEACSINSVLLNKLKKGDIKTYKISKKTPSSETLTMHIEPSYFKGHSIFGNLIDVDMTYNGVNFDHTQICSKFKKICVLQYKPKINKYTLCVPLLYSDSDKIKKETKNKINDEYDKDDDKDDDKNDNTIDNKKYNKKEVNKKEINNNNTIDNNKKDNKKEVKNNNTIDNKKEVNKKEVNKKEVKNDIINVNKKENKKEVKNNNTIDNKKEVKNDIIDVNKKENKKEVKNDIIDVNKKENKKEVKNNNTIDNKKENKKEVKNDTIDVNKKENKRRKYGSIDLGLRTFATLTSGNQIIEFSKSYEYDKNKIIPKGKIITHILNLIELEKIKNTNKKIRKKIKKERKKIKNCSNEIHWKIIKYLTDNYENIIVGDFKCKGTLEGEKLKGWQKILMSSYSFYKFKQRLEYKCKNNKTNCMFINEKYSTMMCCNCSELNEVGSSKVFNCKYCKLTIPRDVNPTITFVKCAMI